jgi:hypothetical protein
LIVHKEQIILLRQRLLGIHPALHLEAHDYQNLQLLFQGLLKQIDAPIDPINLWLKLAEVFAFFQDGHTTIILTRSSFEKIPQKLFFPFKLLPCNGDFHLLQEGEAPDSVKLGGKVLKINGVDVQLLINNTLHYISGESNYHKRNMINQIFGLYLNNYFHNPQSYFIEILDRENSKVFEYQSISSTKYWKQILKQTKKEAIKYDLVPNENYALLEINNFAPENEDSFLETIDDFFESFSLSRKKSLVVDIRNNAGGDSALADIILEHLIPDDFLTYQTIVMRNTQNTKEESEEFVQMTNIKHATDGHRYLSTLENILILASENTFSSAVGFLATLIAHRKITVVGRKTGGIPNAFGDCLLMPHPELFIDYSISEKFFISPLVYQGYNGIEPDLEITDPLWPYWSKARIHQMLRSIQVGKDV